MIEFSSASADFDIRFLARSSSEMAKLAVVLQYKIVRFEQINISV